MNTDCLFCKIVNRDLPSSIVAETETLLAFHDIEPQAPTHILIIPKKHIATLNDLNQENQALLGEMTLLASQLAKQEGISEDGYRLVINCNAAGGQAVYHIHMHLIGGRDCQWPPG